MVALEGLENIEGGRGWGADVGVRSHRFRCVQVVLSKHLCSSMKWLQALTHECLCCVVLPTLQVGEQLKRMPGGGGNNPFAQMVEDADGLDKIEALQVRAEMRLRAAHLFCLKFLRNRVRTRNIETDKRISLIDAAHSSVIWSLCVHTPDLCLLGSRLMFLCTLVMFACCTPAGARQRGPVREGCVHAGDLL